MGNITIIGGGSWGTALSLLLYKKGYKPKVWEYYKENVSLIKRYKENKRYLKGVKLPHDFFITSVIEEALNNKTDIIILAIPSQTVRENLKKIKNLIKERTLVVSGVKGIEINTFMRISQVIEDELRDKLVDIGVLSGPSHAEEVARGLPTAVVASSKDKEVAKFIQNLFSGVNFRVYMNQDLIGVELAGALKNIIAIACGLADGLGLGDNAKAALMVRGITEMSRLGVSLGAEEGTFFGLAGIGDVIATCTSRYSRNRRLGELIAKGKPLKEAIREIGMVTEGVDTTRAVIQRFASTKENISLPITQEVYGILFNKTTPEEAIRNLMLRELKEER
jgi:glycerol-3-phosphate dehydrogenase (NAD(P)+)